MSMFLLPKRVVSNLDKHRCRFFWQGGNGKKNYHLVKWSRICRSKTKDGLGVKDLRKQNISLLVKWWWKLDALNGLWQDIVKAKYVKTESIATVRAKFSDSPIWKDLLKVKYYYLEGSNIITNSGNLTRVWHDVVGDNIPMKLFFLNCLKYVSFKT